MKKLIAILTALMMSLVLVACTADNNENTEISSTEPQIQATVSETTTESKKIDTVTAFLDEMGKDITITNRIWKDASCIGATDGYGFDCNGKQFEVYKFTDKNEIEEAKTGTYTFIIKGMESFGEFSSLTKVNGDFVLLYDVEDAEVIEAFESVK